MAIFLKTISIIAIVFLVLFFLSLIIYFFNLDMKLLSKMQPLINKWYDGHKRRPLP
jgi:hypothetical protein